MIINLGFMLLFRQKKASHNLGALKITLHVHKVDVSLWTIKMELFTVQTTILFTPVANLCETHLMLPFDMAPLQEL